MVNQTVDVGRVFHALSDATRRDIVHRLKTAPRSVSTLAAPYRMSLPALTKHLAVLEAAGLVRTAKTGRIRVCTLEADALHAAAAWLNEYEDFWTDRLDALETHLEENP